MHSFSSAHPFIPALFQDSAHSCTVGPTLWRHLIHPHTHSHHLQANNSHISIFSCTRPPELQTNCWTALLGYPTSFSHWTTNWAHPLSTSPFLLAAPSMLPIVAVTQTEAWNNCQLLSLPHLLYPTSQGYMLNLWHSSHLLVFHSYHFRLSAFPTWFITNSFSRSPCCLSFSESTLKEALYLKLELITPFSCSETFGSSSFSKFSQLPFQHPPWSTQPNARILSFILPSYISFVHTYSQHWNKPQTFLSAFLHRLTLCQKTLPQKLPSLIAAIL